MLTTKQRAYLRKLSNETPALFQIGKGGLNQNQLKQFEDALEARELIKVKVLETAYADLRETCGKVCTAIGAEPVQCIGRMFVIYRQAKEKENRKILLP